MVSIAIIGAGISGLAAAHILRDAGQTVTLFEKSRGVGGRAATRKRNGFIYDYGAQYIKPGHTLSTSWITERFASPDLINITKPVWIFDQHGHIQAGDSAQNQGPKWTYRYGLSTLPKLMAKELTIHQETLITRLVQTTTGWELFDANDSSLGTFDRVLVTIPLPQASELLTNSTLDPQLQAQSNALLQEASYRPLLSVTLGYQPTPRKRPFYALVNPDKGHPISWLAWEHEKIVKRVPPRSGLLIAQMAPQYSHEHWDSPVEETFRDVAQQITSLLEEKLSEPIFTNIQRWRYALPDRQADAEKLNTLTRPAGLAFCGDGFVGGRVALALEHGIAVAGELL